MDTATQRAARGLDLVTGSLAATLVLWLLNVVLRQLAPGVASSADLVFELVWFGSALALAIGCFMAAGASAAPFLLTAGGSLVLVVAAIELLTRLLYAQRELVSSFPLALLGLVSGLSSLLGLVERGLLAFGLVRLAQARRPWVGALALTSVILSLLRTGLSMAVSFVISAAGHQHLSAVLLASSAVGLVSLAALLAVAWAAREAVREHHVTPTVRPGIDRADLEPAPAPPPGAGSDLLVGAIFLFIGLVVSVASFSAASQGGRYVVATGAIAVGVVRLGRGVLRLVRGG